MGKTLNCSHDSRRNSLKSRSPHAKMRAAAAGKPKAETLNAAEAKLRSTPPNRINRP
jgi:hypothetical protein